MCFRPFTPTQEDDLVEYVLKCIRHYYGISINELKQLIYQFARKLGVDYPPWDEDEMADSCWYYKFMERHPYLVLQTPEQTSMNRAKAFCATNVEAFFKNLGDLMDEFHFPALRIYNMDECGFSTVPPKIGRVISMRRMRRVGQLEAAERGTMMTMALTIDASGNSLPPFFLFAKKIMKTCYLDNVSSGAVGFANDAGWMSQRDFVQFMHHFITFSRSSLQSPALLLLDNHTSHLSVEALDLAVKNGVHILSFPPHCSHRLQPLDVSVFGPVKAVYKSQCSAWQKNNASKVLEIRHLAGLVCKTLDIALNPGKIKSGFKSTGICPLDPDIFDELDFIQAVKQNAKEASNETLVDEDAQRRIVSTKQAASATPVNPSKKRENSEAVKPTAKRSKP